MRPLAFVIWAGLGLATAGLPAPGAAQAPTLELSPDDQRELELANENGSIASALYVSGVVTNVLGVLGTFGGLLWALFNTSCSISGCGGDSGSSGPLILVFGGLGLFTAGLGLIFTGIGFDVDSGRRRGALRERNPSMFISFAPAEGGALR